MFAWLTGSAARPPVYLRLRSSKMFITITVATAVFTDIFVYGIVVPVLPFALTERSNVEAGSVQTWISIFLAVYGAALLFASPICGWLADRTSSRRLPLLLGLVALGASTAMLMVGDSIGVLAAGRVLQGVSAAVVWVVGLALLVDTVGGEGVGEAMGYVGMSMSLGLMIAPLLGGIVFSQAGYYAVFAMAFGLIGFDIILRLVMVEKKIAAKWLTSEELAEASPGREKEEGSGEEQTARSEAAGGERGFPSAPADQVQQTTTTTTNDNNALAPTRSHAGEDLLPESAPPRLKKLVDRMPAVVYLLSSRRIMSGLWCSMIQSVFLCSFDAILPLFVRDVFNWDALGAGLIFLPIVIMSFTGPVIGWMVDKVGPRWFVTAGFVTGCPFMILLRLVDHDTINQKVLLCALLALVGISNTVVLTPIMAEVTYAVEAKARNRPPGFFGKNGAYAQAYSLFNMAWAAGSMIGPLLSGLVKESAGWGVTTLILGIVSIVTTIPAFYWTGGSIRKQRKLRQEAAVHG